MGASFSGLLGRHRDDDLRRTQIDGAEPVAGLDDLERSSSTVTRGRLLEDRLVPLRVEGSPDLAERREPELLDDRRAASSAIVANGASPSRSPCFSARSRSSSTGSSTGDRRADRALALELAVAPRCACGSSRTRPCRRLRSLQQLATRGRRARRPRLRHPRSRRAQDVVDREVASSSGRMRRSGPPPRTLGSRHLRSSSRGLGGLVGVLVDGLAFAESACVLVRSTSSPSGS